MPNNTTNRIITFGNTTLEYVLVRKRIKNINLRIRPDCTVLVSAPLRLNADIIDNFVWSKSDYILASLTKFREKQLKNPPKEYITGEIFCIFGESLELIVIEGVKDNITTDSEHIYLTVKSTDDFARKEKLMKKYFLDRCRVVFTVLTEELYPHIAKYNVSPPTIRIREMKSQWGSCLTRKGIITLNSRLALFPLECSKYVVLHELCHFVHPNHSKAFYNLVGEFMPDWNRYRQALRK